MSDGGVGLGKVLVSGVISVSITFLAYEELIPGPLAFFGLLGIAAGLGYYQQLTNGGRQN